MAAHLLLTPDNYAMILDAFCRVFPQAAVWYETSVPNSFTVVTGAVDGPLWDWDAVDRGFAIPRVRAELADLGVERPEEILSFLLVRCRELEPWLEEVPPHVDDLPAVEYESGALMSRNRPWLVTFSRLLALRPEAPPEEWLQGLPPERRAVARRLWTEQGERMALHRRWLEERLGTGAGL